MSRGTKSKELEASLEPLHQSLNRWRRYNRGRRLRIPEELWEESVRAAAKYGVAGVSKRLRLDYYGLKSRLSKLGVVRQAEEQVPTFVELLPLPERKSLANAIELQKAGGSRLRIEFHGELTRELSSLSERLWRGGR